MADYLEVLKRARAYELEVNVQIEHIERLHRIAAKARGSAQYSASIVEKLAALEQEVNAQIDRAVDAKREAMLFLSALTGEEQAVMYSYFILAKDWSKIANDLYMSERRVFLLRKSALGKLSKRYSRDIQTDYGSGGNVDKELPQEKRSAS